MSMPQTDSDALPLSGIKVVDFSRLLPGPWCAQLLGDLGAEVIKVERPEGDPSRHNPPLYRTESVYFCSVNGNKRSAALDLSRREDIETARRLIAEADVLVESFGAGRAKKLGVDWETAQALNPRLVYCSMTGFGQSGPLAHIPGHDLAVQAMSGILGVTKPAMPAFQAGDYSAAAMAVIGILAALRARDRSGRGRFLDIAMFDSLVGMGNIALATALSRQVGGPGAPAMEVWGGNPRYAIYPTHDGGSVAVCLLETKIWREFCRAIGRTDLIFEDENPSDRLSSHGGRAALYRTAIAEFCLAHTRDEIAARMIALGLPVLPVLSPAEAVESEHVAARGLVQPIEHPTEGATLTIATGLAPSGLVRRQRLPAPLVGELKGAGFTSPEHDGAAARPA
jgi:crotonobetainyl-CoA:carnitine CoA-transferase CaiB-like acyl-CoA transferase